MPFGTITAQTIAYEPRQPGIYSRTGLTFDQPADEYRIRGASSGRKGAPISATVTRLREKDVTVGSSLQRLNCVVTLNVQLPSTGGFTAAEIDFLVADISEFINPVNVSRLLQGES